METKKKKRPKPRRSFTIEDLEEKISWSRGASIGGSHGSSSGNSAGPTRSTPVKGGSEGMATLSDDRREFPADVAAKKWILDPSQRWRFYWDVACMVLMLYVLYITPFELAFVHRLKPLDALQVINFCVDFGFLLEIGIALNTAYFDNARNIWVTDRPSIFKRYAASWMWIDIGSLPRWDLILASLGGSSQFKFLRLLRLSRLVRLVRILRAPEIMERLMNRVALSFKSSLVLKYFFVLLSILHVEACAIRLAHDIVRHERRNLDVATVLTQARWRIYRPKFRHTNFNVYVDCLDWAFQTLLGQSVYVNTTEGILSIINNFVGVMFISYLIGDLANVLCNLDPAKNEYKKTVDMLNVYMSEHYFPEEMKWQLRVYLAHSEDLFRSRFHDDLIGQLSPPLQELVAHFMLGGRVLQAPFFSYARQATLGLVAGRRIWVKQLQPEAPPSTVSKVRAAMTRMDSSDHLHHQPHYDDNDVREAKIILLHGGMCYDVRYLDDDSIERYVTSSRISMEHEPPEMQRAMDNMNHTTKLIVTQFARVMKMSLFNGGDYVIRKNVSRTKRMYLVDRGTCIAFGRDITKPFGVTHYREGGCFGDSELAMLAAGHRPRLHWYNVRAVVMTRTLVLNADDFLDIISTPGYEDFYRYIQRYGKWANFKVNFYLALKDGSLHQRLGGTWQNPDNAGGVSKLDQSKALEAMMNGAASNHYERLLACKLAQQTEHTAEMLLEQRRHQDQVDAQRAEELQEVKAQLAALHAKLDLLLGGAGASTAHSSTTPRTSRPALSSNIFPSNGAAEHRRLSNVSSVDGDGVDFIDGDGAPFGDYTAVLATSDTPRGVMPAYDFGAEIPRGGSQRTTTEQPRIFHPRG